MHGNLPLVSLGKYVRYGHSNCRFQLCRDKLECERECERECEPVAQGHQMVNGSLALLNLCLH